MARKAQRQPERQEYVAAIQQLQAQNQQLAQMVMQERNRNQQSFGMNEVEEPQERKSDSPLGAYNTLWGNGNHKKNQNSYDGSAFKQLWG